MDIQVDATFFDKSVALLRDLAHENSAPQAAREARELLDNMSFKAVRPGVQEAVALLNELLKLDYNMVSKLVGTYAPANEFVAKHPTVQAGVTAIGYETGFLGILNGLLTLNTNAEGYVGLRLSPDGKELLEFIVEPPPPALTAVK